MSEKLREINPRRLPSSGKSENVKVSIHGDRDKNTLYSLVKSGFHTDLILFIVYM